MMMRIMRRESQIADRMSKFLLISDYITYFLTGETAIPWSLAARTMAFDVRAKKWDTKLLEAAGINSGLLSTPVPDGSPIGKILKSQADKLDLPPDILLSPAVTTNRKRIGLRCLCCRRSSQHHRLG